MASTSKQLIACMSKAKGNARKIAACKASFSKSLRSQGKEAEKHRKFIRSIDEESAGDNYQVTA